MEKHLALLKTIKCYEDELLECDKQILILLVSEYVKDKQIEELNKDKRHLTVACNYLAETSFKLQTLTLKLVQENKELLRSHGELLTELEKSEENYHNDIKWSQEEYAKARHEILKLNNIIYDLEQQLKSEIVSKTSYQTEFKEINSLLTKKEIEVVELRKQLKILQRENTLKHNALVLSESKVKELNKKLEILRMADEKSTQTESSTLEEQPQENLMEWDILVDEKN
jgi:chromosome segregation ATPase